MPGPAPSRNPRRRNARPDWRQLPPAGRSGPPPDWPLGRQTARVKTLWTELWASPQATAWGDLGWTRVVARYTTLLLEAEKRDASAALLSEVRQLEDRLGLTPMAMRRLQWEIGPADAAADEGTPAGVTSIDDYRSVYG
jgi:hypothetical protein